jgi:hypothetical protein
MKTVSTKPELSQPTTERNSHLFDDWFGAPGDRQEVGGESPSQ